MSNNPGRKQRYCWGLCSIQLFFNFYSFYRELYQSNIANAVFVSIHGIVFDVL